MIFRRGQSGNTRHAGVGLAHALGKHAPEASRDRCEQHGERGHRRENGRHLRIEERAAAGRRDDHEGELARRGEQKGRLDRHGARTGNQAHGKEGDDALEQKQPEKPAGNDPQIAQHALQVEAHADSHEEQAEQQPFEGFEVDLGLVLELGFAKQETGQEGAQRQGKSCPGREHRRADNDQQQERHQEVAPALGRVAEDAVQAEAADQHDDRDRDRALNQRFEHCRQQTGFAVPAQKSDQDEDRRDQNILKQEDGERGSTDRLQGAPLLGQHLHDDRRGGKCEREPDCKRGRRRQAGDPCCARNQSGTDESLQAANPEHRAAQLPELLKRQLEAEQEEQEEHAKFGEGRCGLRL